MHDSSSTRTMVCALNSASTHRQNRSFAAGILALGLLVWTTSAWSMPNSDSFGDQTADGGSDYALGSALGGQTNAPYYRWNPTGTTLGTIRPTIIAGNLSYVGLPASSGNSVAVAPSTNLAGGVGARLDLRISTTATAYYSLLLKVTDLANVPAANSNNPIAAFCDDPKEQGVAVQRLGSRLVSKRSGSGYVLGIGRNGTAEDYVYDSTVRNVNEVLFVVASYELTGGVTNVNLWINPAASSFGEPAIPAPTVSADTFTTMVGNLGNNGPRAFGLLCQYAGAPSATIDEVRVGRTWAAVTGGVEFSLQPTNQTALTGGTVVLYALAAGANPLTYTWQKDGVNLPNSAPYSGVNTRTLTITGAGHAQAGNYTVMVTGGVKPAYSDGAYLTINDPILDPRIITQPVSTTNLVGATVTFHVAAAGTSPFYYQWYKGVNLLWDSGNISGANTDTLTLTAVSNTDQADYSVVVINGLGASVTSDLASLTIVNPIAISAEPTPRVVPLDGKTVMAVGFSGTGPVSYQWQLEGTNLPGATAAAYVVNHAQPIHAGAYRAIITGPGNSVTSAVAALKLATQPARLPATNVVVLRVGDGAQTLTTKGNSMFLDSFTASGVIDGTVAIPDSGPAALVATGPNIVTLSGGSTSISGNGLSKSLNRQFLLLGAYHTNLNYTADLNSSGAAAVPRGIALVDAEGRYSLIASVTNAFGGTFWRGAVGDGTNNYWGWGRAPGTYYFGFDDPATLVQGDWSNLRSMGIFNGSIYGVSAVSGKTGVMKLPGLPTVTNDVQVVITTGRGSSSDCDVSPDGAIIYLADSAKSESGGGVQRWDFDGANYNLSYTLSDGLPAGAMYVTVDFSRNPRVVYAVSGENENNRIVRIEDTGAAAAGATIAAAGSRQVFRGAQLGPQPAPPGQPLLSATPADGVIVLDWQGSYFLQSAPEVLGPYADVINGTRPFTNSTTSEARRFFRLRQ